MKRVLVVVENMPGAPEDALQSRALNLVCPTHARVLLRRMVGG